jgi:hypothetical protein
MRASPFSLLRKYYIILPTEPFPKIRGRVVRVVKDKRVLKLIRSYLESGVMVNGVVMETEEGTPQGVSYRHYFPILC